MFITSSQSRSSVRQRGFTLIELMVGMVIGLIILSAALAIYLMGVRGSTYAVRAAKLNQEMRTGMTLIVEDIRRAGYWGDFQENTPNPFTNRDAANPPVTDIHILPFNDVPNSCILYSYDATYQANNVSGPDQTGDPGTDFFGFRLTADSALEMRHGGNSTNNCDANDNWQPITDPNTVAIQTLSFTTGPTHTNLDSRSQCLNTTTGANWEAPQDSTVPACDSFSTSETPKTGERLIELRQINIRMVAQHVNDPEMRATLEQSVKIRNDRVFTF